MITMAGFVQSYLDHLGVAGRHDGYAGLRPGDAPWPARDLVLGSGNPR